ncbi:MULTISPECIES: LysR family transcriptional regulator [Amycolatopsis]|uniref:LysR family transcriptional regulator n=1 Tax=Amycolatopsis bullii TaxID=941987 RepID=A0ABQ3KDD1_9PSEU|nr:LysR family transcriptional regulator [Amycolatopsis bullii]GHG14347.1 LysR family transcriptional regulator [Amycolatopsis bullii]
MESPQLEAFVTVVDVGSFTRAAARLQLSQPSVTGRIKALEHDVGVRLLERRHSGIRPTPAGAELLPYAREIVALTARARTAIDSEGRPHGRVRIGTIDFLTTHRLLPLIEYLYLRYPEVQISMSNPADGDAAGAVRDGKLDCAFVVDVIHDREDLDSRVLCPESLVLVGGADHALARRTPVTDEDLRAATLVRADNAAQYHERFERTIGLEETANRPRLFELDSIEATKRSVANGVGIALLPAAAVRRELADGRLHEIDWTPSFKSFTQVVWRRDRGPNTALDALVSAAVQVVREQVAERIPVPR